MSRDVWQCATCLLQAPAGVALSWACCGQAGGKVQGLLSWQAIDHGSQICADSLPTGNASQHFSGMCLKHAHMFVSNSCLLLSHCLAATRLHTNATFMQLHSGTWKPYSVCYYARCSLCVLIEAGLTKYDSL